MLYLNSMFPLNKILNRIIEYSFYLLFFLVPLVMTPWNYELFEFNKTLAVYFFTLLIVFSWGAKMIIQKKFLFQKSFWDLPLLIFLGVQLLSFVFSISHHTSLWGYYSRFNGGLVSLACFALLYWALVGNLRQEKVLNSLVCLLTSGFIVAAYGVAEHFGVDAQHWVQDVQNRVFSTLGQPNWLAAWLVILIPLTWAFFLRYWRLSFRNWPLILVSVVFLVYLLAFLYTKSRSGLLGLGVSFMGFWGLLFWLTKEIKKFRWPFLIITAILVILNLVVKTPWQPRFLQFKNPPVAEKSAPRETIVTGGTESGEIRRVVWKGALSLWQHHPFLGTGPETFAYSYYWYRPREHNDVSEWDFLYNKAHNEYLNYAATSGTVGLLAYLGLILTFLFKAFLQLKKVLKSQDLKMLSLIQLGLLAGFLSLLVTNFFGFAVAPISLLFFLTPALFWVLGQPAGKAEKVMAKKAKLSLTWPQQGGLMLCLLLAGFFLWRVGQYWSADRLFALGEKLNKAGESNQAFGHLQKAIALRPEPIYHDELGLVSASLAVIAFNQEQATLSAQLTELALKSSNQALKSDPYNLNFWKNRTRLFYTLAENDPQYTQSALDSLLTAAKLAPTDAKIQYNLALVYAKLEQEETAIKTLEQTIDLKPNYDHARYALALFYEKKGETEKAREQLNYILAKINPNYEAAIEKLKNLK